MKIQVKDFMSAPVITAKGENSFIEVRALMKDKGINAIPIISYSKDILDTEMIIRGIVNTTDMNKDVQESTTVEDVMTSSRVQ
ncbi:CBS domain-containing protein [Bizionia sp.]|uniref:CBS domain-containing protein n=1 Tax=Bizionia sp. TaxID=1954480 RepID=UPI003A92324B